MSTLVEVANNTNYTDSTSHCFECNRRACIHCLDCGIGINYCESCCISAHTSRHVYHNPEFWTGYRFVPAPLRNIVVGRDHNCMTKLTVVTLNSK